VRKRTFFASPANEWIDTLSTESANSPVIVIGYPRSGTTLVLHILLSSGEFSDYNFSETHFFSHYYRRYGSLRKRKNLEKFLAEISKSEWIQNSDITPDELQAEVGKSGSNYESYFSAFMNLITRKQGESRWVEKTPWHMLYVAEIKQALPDAKFIFVMRDPRDTIQSVLAYGWTEGFFTETTKLAVAWNWHINHTTTLLEKMNIPYLTVKYEDLTGNTEHSLNALNDFLGLQLDSDTLKSEGVGVLKRSNSSYNKPAQEKSNQGEGETNASHAGISARSKERWHETMNSQAICEVEYITRENLIKYGYTITSQCKPTGIGYLKIKILGLLYNFHKVIRHLLFPAIRR